MGYTYLIDYHDGIVTIRARDYEQLRRDSETLAALMSMMSGEDETKWHEYFVAHLSV